MGIWYIINANYYTRKTKPMTFEYGFAINGIFYGWHDKQLYRLPSKIGNRHYSFRQVKPIKVGNKVGYRVNRQTKSIDQLRGITISFLSPIKIQTNEHIA